MKISFLSLSFGKFYNMDKIFEVASECGYDGVDIWGGRPQAYPYDMDEAACNHILELKDKYKLEVPAYTPEALSYPYNLASPIEKERKDTVAYFKKAIEVADAIGAPRVQLACGPSGPQISRREVRKNMTQMLTEIAEHADKHNVNLILEAVTTYESNIVAYLDDIVEILDDVNHPRLLTMMDTVTPYVHGESYSDWFERLGKKIDYIHFINSDGSSPTHLSVNSGVIPMGDLLNLFRKHGYDGWLCSELVSVAREPELAAAKEIKAIKALL